MHLPHCSSQSLSELLWQSSEEGGEEDGRGPLGMVPSGNKGLWNPEYTQELVAGEKKTDYLVESQVQWPHPRQLGLTITTAHYMSTL